MTDTNTSPFAWLSSRQSHRPWVSWGDRVLGAALSATKVGPGVRHPAYHDLLIAFGMLSSEVKHAQRPVDTEHMPGGPVQATLGPGRPQDGFDGMWPRSSPWGEGLWPTITGLDASEVSDHVSHTATRYLGQLARMTPVAAWRAWRGPRLAPISDAQFTTILTHTALGCFVRLGLSTLARTRFARVLSPQKRYAVVDASGIAPDPSFMTGAGFPPVPAVVLLTRRGLDYEVCAIALEEEIFTPEDGVGWELARYFALMAVNYRFVLGTHGRLHFPHDIINALTKTLLPSGHLVTRLLGPHARFTLGLDNGVMNHARSVAHNDQAEIYTPFSITRDAIKTLFSDARLGRDDGSDFTAYRFGDEMLGEHTPVGRFRRQWYDAFCQFARDVLQGVPRDDPYIQRWAHEIGKWVAGFPEPELLRDPMVLADTVALHMATVSVFHTTDHHSYSLIPRHWMPFRLRIAPPHHEPPPALLDLDTLVTREDHLRSHLANELFFRPTIIEPLSEITYPFLYPGPVRAARAFAQTRERIDACWRGSMFPTSDAIATGIQY